MSFNGNEMPQGDEIDFDSFTENYFNLEESENELDVEANSSFNEAMKVHSEILEPNYQVDNIHGFYPPADFQSGIDYQAPLANGAQLLPQYSSPQSAVFQQHQGPPFYPPVSGNFINDNFQQPESPYHFEGQPECLLVGDSLGQENVQCLKGSQENLGQNFGMGSNLEWSDDSLQNFVLPIENFDGQNNQELVLAHHPKESIGHAGQISPLGNEGYLEVDQVLGVHYENVPTHPAHVGRHDVCQGIIQNEEQFRALHLPHLAHAVRKTTDFPKDAAGQRALVSRLFGAIRNTEGVRDNEKVVKSFREGDTPDLVIELSCWELLLAAKEASEVGRLVHKCHDGKHEGYGSFSERFEQIIKACTESKAFCKSVLLPRFSHRAADQPAAELKRKDCNARLNKKKTQQNKAGQEAMQKGLVDTDGNWNDKEKISATQAQDKPRRNKRIRSPDVEDAPAPKRVARSNHDLRGAQPVLQQNRSVSSEEDVDEDYEDEEYEDEETAPPTPLGREFRHPRTRHQTSRQELSQPDQSQYRQHQDMSQILQQDGNIDPRIQRGEW